MKNIHMLPTEQPSRLGKFIDTNNLFLRTSNDIPRGENVYIYITSDEEIKEGDWGWYHNELQKSDGISFKSVDKKIILTTDQDLIKDGVQAIDDEFLQWFVQNPSCEEVEVGYGWIRLTETDNEGYWVSIPNKQFEMQQEEPKQIKCYCGHTTYCDCGPLEEPKQETLEEATERLIKLSRQDGFYEGAKWQQERMYSEEDLRNAYFSAIQSTGEGWNGEYAQGNSPNIEETFQEEFNQWFEQFKKKKQNLLGLQNLKTYI